MRLVSGFLQVGYIGYFYRSIKFVLYCTIKHFPQENSIFSQICMQSCMGIFFPIPALYGGPKNINIIYPKGPRADLSRAVGAEKSLFSPDHVSATTGQPRQVEPLGFEPIGT